MSHTAINVPVAAGAAYVPIAADGSNGNKYQNDGKLRLLIHNPLAASLTLTIVTPETRAGNAVADKVIAFSDVFYMVEVLVPITYNVGSGTDQGAVTMTWGGTLTDVVCIVA